MNLGDSLKCYQCGGVDPEPECPSSNSMDHEFYEFLMECDGICHNETNGGNGNTTRKCMALGYNELGCITTQLLFGGVYIGKELFQTDSLI